MTATQSDVRVGITVNDTLTEHQVEARTLLVQYLRDVVGLTGTSIGCDSTSCGACTVLLAGESVKSCTVLAVQADGRHVQTIEGVAAKDSALHPIQAALSRHHGLQCGYCTPGVVMTLLELDHDRNGRALGEDEIRAALSGNLCRCTGYQGMVDAALELFGAEAASRIITTTRSQA